MCAAMHESALTVAARRHGIIRSEGCPVSPPGLAHEGGAVQGEAMTESAGPSLRAKRQAVVREHIDSERDHDFDRTLATFTRPRYEVMPTGDVFDSDADVLTFLKESHVAFPDFGFENEVLHHADDAVIVEIMFVGTHQGMWRGLPATGRRVRYKMCNVFVFEGESLVCERLHFDLLTVLQQLGIARDPTTLAGRLNTFASHPLVVARAFLQSLRG